MHGVKPDHQRLRASGYLMSTRDRHVLRQIGRRLRHPADLHRTRLGIDARVDVGQRGGEALAREGVGQIGRLAQGQPAQMPLVRSTTSCVCPSGDSTISVLPGCTTSPTLDVAVDQRAGARRGDARNSAAGRAPRPGPLRPGARLASANAQSLPLGWPDSHRLQGALTGRRSHLQRLRASSNAA